MENSSEELTVYNRLRDVLTGKTRIAVAWVFSIVLVLSASKYPSAPGILLCFVGASIRFWSSGFLRKDQYPAVGGPYSLSRNPLYLGTYLMMVGICWSIEAWVFLILTSTVFFFIYHFVILEEEKKLQKIFGTSYQQYCLKVPRFFPRLWPIKRSTLMMINPKYDHRLFDWSLALKNKAYEAYLTFAALVMFVFFIAFARKNWLETLLF